MFIYFNIIDYKQLFNRNYRLPQINIFFLDWEEEEKQETNILRLIYQGRFLHGNVSLGALQLPTGKTTVMHLVARENLPEPNSQGEIISLRKNGPVGSDLCRRVCIS